MNYVQGIKSVLAQANKSFERSPVSASFTWNAITISRMLFSSLDTINMYINPDRHQSIHSFFYS